MITGFNTDVEHDGVIYHVQTEDKGLDRPIILSLVYVGGTILASKRAPYEDLIAQGFSDEVLAERLKRQHRLICAAINSGRIDDLKKMSRRVVEEPPLEAEPVVESHAEAVTEAIQEETTEAISEPEAQDEFEIDEEVPVKEEVEIPMRPIGVFDLELEEIPSQTWSPPPKVEPSPPTPETEGEAPASELAYGGYAAHDSRGQIDLRDVADGLSIILLNDAEFNSGELRTLRVLIVNRKGDEEKPLNGAAVSVKILGTTFRPLIYSLKTDRDGVASITAQIPEFTSGRAAVLVRAVARDQAAELRRVIHPGS